VRGGRCLVRCLSGPGGGGGGGGGGNGVCLVSTPMGNPGDITLRAIEMLRTCDVIAAEDTRKCQLLLRAVGIETRAKLMSHHEHNSEESIPKIIAHAKRGALVAVVSDAGTPTINDPGQKLAHACVQQGIALSIAPGVSAPIAAMSLSGLLCSEWLYVGFLPRTSSKRRRKLSELAREERAVVMLESPHRLVKALAELAESAEWMPEREISCCRELTKRHEEVVRGTVASALAHFADDPPRGEFTLVLGRQLNAGRQREREDDEAAVRERLQILMAHGMPASGCATLLSKELKRPRSPIYKAALALQSAEAAAPGD